MPKYFFSSADGARHTDDDGMDLPDHAAARAAAIKYAGAILQHEPDVLENGHNFRVEVTDHMHRLLFTIVAFTFDTPSSRPSDQEPLGRVG